ncbi:signal peptidase I [Streptomyces sp. NPDC051098]
MRRRRPKRRLRVAGLVLLAVGLLGTTGTLVPLLGYSVRAASGDSMTPGYAQGDAVFFDEAGPDDVRRGDIVLFRAPAPVDQETMKRVVGVGGDSVACCDSGERVTVNGKPLREPYLRDGDAVGGAPPYDVKVPDGQVFLLGDNRMDSLDSRFFEGGGTVPVGAVKGRADDTAVPVLLIVGVVVSGMALLAGAGLGLADWVTGRRRRARPAGQFTGPPPGAPPAAPARPRPPRRSKR